MPCKTRALNKCLCPSDIYKGNNIYGHCIAAYVSGIFQLCVPYHPLCLSLSHGLSLIQCSVSPSVMFPGSFLPPGCVLRSNRRQIAAQGVYHHPDPVGNIPQLWGLRESTMRHVVPRPGPSTFTAEQGGTSRRAGDDLS